MTIPQSQARRSQQGGFSLLEVLAVVTIMSLLAAMAVPAVGPFFKAGTMNQNLVELSGAMDQARQYALAQNTYVWVALHPDTDKGTVSVALIGSKNGEDASPWGNYGAVPNAQIALITKTTVLRQIQLEDAGALTADKITKLPATPVVGADNSLANGTASFDINVPQTGATEKFTRVVQFMPNGQARVAAAPIDVIELGVRSKVGSTVDNNNVAVLRINGLTGQTSIYRP